MAKALDYESLNEKVQKVQLAVRGELCIRASEHQMEGEEITATNVGNTHALEQKPLTFSRQVVALCQAPFLLEDPNVGLQFPADAIERAKHYLAMASGGPGASSDSRGLPGIRKEVAEFIERRDGYPSDPELIFLIDGASKGVLQILNAIIRGVGDGVLCPGPQYPLYSAAITQLGGTHLPYFLEETANWLIDVNDLRNAATEAGRKGIPVRALSIVNPGKTGQCLSESNLREILHFCYEEKLVLLGDEVYQQNINQDECPFISARKVLIEMGPPFSKEVQLVSFYSVLDECGYFEMFNIYAEVDEIYKVGSKSLSPNVPAQICMGLMVNPPKSGDISYDQYITEKMKDSRQQPLVSPVNVEHHLPPKKTSITAVFVPGADDIPPITSSRIFFRELYREMIKLWYIAGPAIFTTLCQYCLSGATQIFMGHVSTIALAAFAIQNFVICNFTQGVMCGMGSALETLCGQAVGAGQLDLLGIFMQRSWVITFSTACIMLFVYIFVTPILKLTGQTEAISEATGTFTLYTIPQLFAMAFNFPMQKFLLAQSRIMVLAVIAAVALVLHVLFGWLLIIKLKLGLVGAALIVNASWWLIDLLQFLYIVSGSCREAWNGFSWKAFHNLWSFVKLSVASAIMIVLETWYFMILVIFAGRLKNAEVSVNALSISMNILGAILYLAMGINAAISVRVSNELGAGHPRATKLSALAAVASSTIIGVVLVLILIIARNSYPSLFSNNSKVHKAVKELTPLLAVSIIVNIVQPALSGLAVGAGWQGYVAYVNIGCYYAFGIPLGVLLGLRFGMGVKGIWYGMLSEYCSDFCFFFYGFRRNWVKEASVAEDRIKKWEGEVDSKESKVSEAT